MIVLPDFSGPFTTKARTLGRHGTGQQGIGEVFHGLARLFPAHKGEVQGQQDSVLDLAEHGTGVADRSAVEAAWPPGWAEEGKFLQQLDDECGLFYPGRHFRSR